MRFTIWGAGQRGERILRRLGEENIVAFLDTDCEKYGNIYLGKRVISFEEYKREYSDTVIIVSFLCDEESVAYLEDREINKYFLFSECPHEFQGTTGDIRILKEHIQKELQQGCRYGVYGHSLYSLFVYEWIKELIGEEVFFIGDENIPKGIAEVLRAEGYHYVPAEEILENNIDRILNCNYTEEELRKRKLTNVKIKNIWDCSCEIDAYHNNKIERFKSLHAGEKCFVVATGPSLRVEDLETLRKNQIVCFSMNFIGKVFSETNWRPRYYVAEDAYFLSNEDAQIDNMEAEYLFIADSDRSFWEKKHTSKILQWHLDISSCACLNMTKFSQDCARVIYCGRTVTYSCIQLAAYMGFKEIYLLGVDCTLVNKRHFYPVDEYDARSLPADYDKMVALWLDAYKKAREYADQNDIKIYNATRGGELEVFERVDFDSLF